MTAHQKVLLVGIDPSVIDYSSGPLATFNPALIMQVLEAGRQKLLAAGLQADMCLIDYGATAEATLSRCLSDEEYDCVVIGAGLREPAETLLLFEKVINLVKRLAPGAAIAFNRNPSDSLEAALRWLRAPD